MGAREMKCGSCEKIEECGANGVKCLPRKAINSLLGLACWALSFIPIPLPYPKKGGLEK